MVGRASVLVGRASVPANIKKLSHPRQHVTGKQAKNEREMSAKNTS
jgi:hypothetical protein